MLRKHKIKFCAYKPCGSELLYRSSSLQRFCSPLCQAKYEEEKAVDLKITKMREDLKNHSWWTQKLQAVFNEFVRTRDKDLPCISCGTTNKVQYHAGHFFSVGGYPGLRFHEDNVHKQCGQNCNKEKHGNLIEYQKELVKKIGQEKFDWLYANRHKEAKLSIPEMKEKIAHYKKQIKELNGPLR